ncbi:MAG: GIY-YIG nuclease family protein [Bacteroidetes bacterium]|nr:GIY-YIG nuclease family protein [Bacteroidota bacterium]
MQYFLYILKSVSHNRYYIGQTSNLQERLKRHNRGDNKSTKPYTPWKLIYSESFHSRAEAVKRESFLKSPSGWIELQNII